MYEGDAYQETNILKGLEFISGPSTSTLFYDITIAVPKSL